MNWEKANSRDRVNAVSKSDEKTLGSRRGCWCGETKKHRHVPVSKTIAVERSQAGGRQIAEQRNDKIRAVKAAKRKARQAKRKLG